MGQQKLQAKVLTVSDSVENGTAEDVGGEALVARLEQSGFEVIECRAVADDVAEVSNALSYMAYGFNGLIVTTGGTGFEPRDITPEATRRILDRMAPGLGDAMRSADPLGRLSRAIAGTRGASLIINVAGVPKGAVEMLESVIDVVPTALREMRSRRSDADADASK
jgi:molybdopterin adenylyltransferase